jgi:hypothetical protein
MGVWHCVGGQVLAPLLLPEELHFIFGRVATLFSKSLADAYARLEPLVGALFASVEPLCIDHKPLLQCP